ncbi:MAG TPA: MoaD/ThiS family protein [Candidatus Methylomirabilis sp.]|nr:MoaD/ThiS family protein [Candidatus Methylomirabilis sp.]
MPTVKLKLSGWLRHSLDAALAEPDGISISVREGESIPGMARQIADQNEGFRKLLFDENHQEFGANVLVILNGSFVNPHDRAEALLREGDEVMLLPVMDGG